MNEDGLTFICVTKSSMPKRLAFMFLYDIQSAFIEQTPETKRRTGIAYCLNSQFVEELKSKINLYNTNPPDKMTHLKKEILETKDITMENIEKLLKREEKIDILIQKTEKMDTLSSHIKRDAHRVKRQALWRNVRITVFIIIAVLVVIYLILTQICGGLALGSCL
eukprot:TRINITY_DN4624_c0_g1_i3.p2 TRINITY_DN4624_c0_g1~~TRINITY_DN4624_c0_g1_i3.p2  ORF type:complete len:165 (+),score=33.02 TRINITY_DN4624_c0_g1_i3:347-841(+)